MESDTLDAAAAFAAGVRAEHAGLWGEAEALYRRVVSDAPGSALANYALGCSLLAQGLYSEGWPLYEARHFVPHFNNPLPPIPLKRWRGEPIAGKRLLIWPEQGLGDQIMFSRFVREIAEAGGHPILFTAPSLAGLLSTLPGEVHPLTGSIDVSTPDYLVMLGSLPLHLGIEPDALSGAPYLTASGAGSGDIGIKVRGAAPTSGGLFRSLPADLAARLLAMPGAVSLEPEDSGASDLLQSAVIIQGLKAVLTVDTSVAHLAGALGKRTVVMLPPSGADWRWSCRQARWYDSVEFIRGADWDEILAKAISALGR
jgi:hypothetical protein